MMGPPRYGMGAGKGGAPATYCGKTPFGLSACATVPTGPTPVRPGSMSELAGPQEAASMKAMGASSRSFLFMVIPFTARMREGDPSSSFRTRDPARVLPLSRLLRSQRARDDFGSEPHGGRREYGQEESLSTETADPAARTRASWARKVVPVTVSKIIELGLAS
jgi:hypothetical protein